MIYQRVYRSWIGNLRKASSTYFNVSFYFSAVHCSVRRPLLRPLLHHHHHHHHSVSHHSVSHHGRSHHHHHHRHPHDHQASDNLPVRHPSPAGHHPQALQRQTHYHDLGTGHHATTHHHGSCHHDHATSSHHRSAHQGQASPQGPEALQLSPLPPRGHLRGRRKRLQLQVSRRARRLRVWEGWVSVFMY